MIAWRQYQAGLCPGCGQPKELAWHPENEGWYDAAGIVCHACTAKEQAQNPKADPTRYHALLYTRGPSSRPLAQPYLAAIQEALEDAIPD